MILPRRRCVVIGGGIAGLTAAYALAADPTYDVVVLESTSKPGGKLRLADIAGVTVDVGAEAMLARRPEGIRLAGDVGLTVVHPTSAAPRVWAAGRLRPLPRTLMGVPQDLTSLSASGVLSPEGFARVAAEADLPRSEVTGDVSVGALVAERMGREVVDQLVEPLLGGVYAGRADEISAQAATPALIAQARRGSWLAQAPAVTSQQPVFAGLTGGMGRLPAAVAERGGFQLRTDVVVRSVRRTGDGFALSLATSTGVVTEEADDIIVATPAAAAAKLLVEVCPVAAAELAQIESASMAIVTLAVPMSSVADLTGSGFLVPPAGPLGIKASTFSWAKWDWVRTAGDGQVAVLRASWGRHRDEVTLQRSDEELIALTRSDLGAAVGLDAPLIDAQVQRWGGGLPQYAVGHLDRVARIRSAVTAQNQRAQRSAGGRVAVCGAAYDGVGIPAVIASAHAAVEVIAAQ